MEGERLRLETVWVKKKTVSHSKNFVSQNQNCLFVIPHALYPCWHNEWFCATNAWMTGGKELPETQTSHVTVIEEGELVILLYMPPSDHALCKPYRLWFIARALSECSGSLKDSGQHQTLQFSLHPHSLSLFAFPVLILPAVIITISVRMQESL